MEIVLFEAGGQRFGLRSCEVREILRAVTILPLPGAPSVLEGVVDVRGRVVPVLDLRLLLGLPPKPLEASDHFIVVQADRRVAILRVDRALDLAEVSALAEPAEALAHGVQFVSEIAQTADGLVHVLPSSRFLAAGESASADLFSPAPAKEAGP